MGVFVEVEVDGGVKADNLEQVLQAGTDTVVVGSSIFATLDVSAAAAEIRRVLDSTSATLRGCTSS